MSDEEQVGVAMFSRLMSGIGHSGWSFNDAAGFCDRSAFVIPRGVLASTLLFVNLAWFGFQDQRWAKYVLFWLFVMACCHSFFARFVG